MLKYTSPKAPSERLVDAYDHRSTTEEQMLAIAAQYFDEVEAAEKEDESRPTYGKSPTGGGEPLTGEAYKKWDMQNPHKTAILKEEYDEKLGIIPTNNLSRWLMDRPPAMLNNPYARAYSIDAEENAQKPGVQELRRLREEKPELFADTQILQKAHSELVDQAITAAKSGMDDDAAFRESDIQGMVSKWALNQQMTRVVYELRALGLTDEGFGELCQ